MTQSPSDGYLDPDGRVTPLPSNSAGVPLGKEALRQDDAALRDQAERNVAARRNLRNSAIVFAMVNGLLWITYLAQLSKDGSKFPWPIFVTVFWGMSLFMQKQRIDDTSNNGGAVTAEMERLRGQRQGN